MNNTKAQRSAGEKAMNTAREKSMKTFEEQYAEPPPYSSQPPSRNPSISNGSSQQSSRGSVPKLTDLNFQPSPLEIPTPAECIAHLKLLHAFAKLRQDVGNREGLFGINIADCTSSTTNAKDSADLAERLREKRWTIFVSKAVERFEKWWARLAHSSTWYSPIRTETFENAVESIFAGKLCK